MAVPTKKRRAKQARAKATMSVIMVAASRVVTQEGYQRATTNRIAEVAGVSVGSIYHYFTNKDDIFDHLIQQETNKALELLAALDIDPRQSLEMTLRILFVSLVRALPQLPALYRQLEQIPNTLMQRRLSERRGAAIAFLRSLLEVHRSELLIDDLELAARLIVYSTEGVAAKASEDSYGDNLAIEMAQMFARYLLSGSRLETGSC